MTPERLHQIKGTEFSDSEIAKLKIIRECVEEIERLTEELALARDLESALKHTVVAIIGGTDDEGNLTSGINYLQRLRNLVALEQQLADTRAELAALRDAAMKQPLKTERLKRLIYHRDGSVGCAIHGTNVVIGTAPDDVCLICKLEAENARLKGGA